MVGSVSDEAFQAVASLIKIDCRSGGLRSADARTAKRA
jgi:hypothetical protein